MSDLWRCGVCKKTKDLSGPHLSGKETIRSDCWPCAKKQTFWREKAGSGGGGGGGGAAAPFIYTTATGSAAAAGGGAPVATKTTQPPIPSNPVTARSSDNPFMQSSSTAAAIGKFSAAFATASNTGTGTTTTVASGTAIPQARIVMERKQGNSPPFTFTAAVTPYLGQGPTFSDPNNNSSNTAGMLPASTGTIAAAAAAAAAERPANNHSSSSGSKSKSKTTITTAAGVSAGGGATAPALLRVAVTPAAAATSSGSDLVWLCCECKKAKDLAGPHLRGLTSVRSDCWPCARKRLFILLNRADLARRSPSLGSSSQRSIPAAALSPIVKPGGGGGGGGDGTSPSSSVARNPFMQAAAAALTASINSNSSAIAGSRDDSTVAATERGRKQGVHGSGSNDNNYTTDIDICTPSFCAPVIPPNEAVTDFYLLPDDDDEEDESGELGSFAVAFGGITDGGHHHNKAVGTATTTSAASSVLVSVTRTQRLQAAFNGQLLQSYRVRLFDDVPLHAVWFGNVIYVIAKEPPASAIQLLLGGGGGGGGGVDGGSNNNINDLPSKQQCAMTEATRAYDMMGRFSALLMSVEAKLAGSRHRRVRRLFCASQFSFAAACCYASQFATTTFASPTGNAHPAVAAAGGGGNTSPPPPPPINGCVRRTGPFAVYGPAHDMTRAPTLCSRIISVAAGAGLAEPCVVVVSENQRLRAAQLLYRRVGWLAMPSDANGAAIQMLREEADEALRNNNDDDAIAGGGGVDATTSGKTGGACSSTSQPTSAAATNCECDVGVDVVLLPGTMRLEDLPKAAALAMPVKQF